MPKYFSAYTEPETQNYVERARRFKLVCAKLNHQVNRNVNPSIIELDYLHPRYLTSWNLSNIPNNEDFAIHRQGQRIGNPAMANICNPNYRKAIIDWCHRMIAVGIDGIMVDVPLWYSKWNEGQIHESDEFKGIPINTDHPLEIAGAVFVNEIREALYPKLVIPNIGSADGCYWPGPATTMLRQMPQLLIEVAFNFANLIFPVKIPKTATTLMIGFEDAARTNALTAVVISHLLAEDNIYFGYNDYMWSNYHEVDLGKPFQPAATINQVYFRQFERGNVVLNMSAVPYRVTGTLINPDLSERAVTNYEVQPKTGVLMRR